MLKRMGKGKYKWAFEELKEVKYSKNDAAFIIDQMDHKLDAVDWGILSDEDANKIAWLSRELTEYLMEVVNKQQK